MQEWILMVALSLTSVNSGGETHCHWKRHVLMAKQSCSHVVAVVSRRVHDAGEVLQHHSPVCSAVAPCA